jgi:hypothetical protein
MGADEIIDLLADAAERGKRGAQRALDLALQELEAAGDPSVITRLAANRYATPNAA